MVERPTRMVGRPSWIAGSGLEALPKCQEWSGGPPGGSGVIGRLSRGPVAVWRQSRKAGSG